MGIRILFGVFCFIFGINKFLNFLPMPPIEGNGGLLMGIYFSSGFMNLIGALEVIFGLALVINKYVPMALTVLLAIMFNALIFHVLHDLAGIGGAALGMILGLFLVYANRDRFSDVLSA